MRVLLSAEGAELDSPLGVNFARSPYYVVVDVDTLAHTAMANPWATARGGAGFEAAKMMAGQGVQAVITGMIGPNAFVALQDAGVPVFAAPPGSLRAAVQAYRAAHLRPLAGPNASPHAPFSRQSLAHGSLDVRPRRGGSRRAERQAEVASLRARVRALEEEVVALREYVREIKKERDRQE